MLQVMRCLICLSCFSDGCSDLFCPRERFDLCNEDGKLNGGCLYAPAFSPKGPCCLFEIVEFKYESISV